MALNTPAKIYSDGSTAKVSVYRVVGVTAADTFQMSTDYTTVIAAYFLPTTMNTAWNVALSVPVSSQTTLTLGGSFSKDDGYLIVFGSSS
jgi:hypothetical protein